MKQLILLILYMLIFCQISTAQKFYDRQDSIDYQHYSMILSGGYQMTVENGVVKRTLVDSSYQNSDNYISFDSAYKLMKKIKKFDYEIRKPNEAFTKGVDLHITDEFDTITQITFEGRNLTKLPILKLLKCKNLKEIELVNTSIKKIPWLLNWSIFKLDSLQTLRIYNHAPNKWIKFKKNTNVEELVYRDSPYSPLPQNIHKLENVRKVDLARNDLGGDARFHLEKFQNLEHLNLSRNNINLSNLANDTVHQLKSIVLSFNNLTSIPAEIGFLKDLVELQFAENGIKSEGIHPALGSLKKLEVLSFYRNDLDSIPPFIFELRNLKEFDLYYNSIEKMPEQLGNLKRLEKLFIAHNRFFSIPESIGELMSLKQFYIHHNRISYLPASIASLEHITDFHIHNNYFQGFPEFILNYKKLEDLDISYNEIHKFPPEIVQLNQLKYLWMRGITFEANGKEEAEELKHTLETLQKNGVKVSIETDQKISP